MSKTRVIGPGSGLPCPPSERREGFPDSERRGLTARILVAFAATAIVVCAVGAAPPARSARTMTDSKVSRAAVSRGACCAESGDSINLSVSVLKALTTLRASNE